VEVLRRHPAYVDRARDRGNDVFVFTVDDAADVERCAASQVDAIITNRPADVLQQLQR
jgi:glycerophosphoryl diester phosphodiesterase